ncbi:MAG: hypothetical protein R3C28_31880 [Pirellulaceae bacterium]
MRAVSVLAVFTVGLLLSGKAGADWFQDFDDGHVPNWEFLPSPFSPSDTFSADASNGYLSFAESRLGNQGGTYAIRAINTAEAFSDVRVSANVNIDPSIGTFMGLTVENLTDAYLFGVDFAVDGDVWLAQAGPAVNGIVQWGSKSHFDIPTALALDGSYFLELDIVGDQMTGRVYDTAGGTELINISHAIPSPLPGPLYAGVYSDTTLGIEHIHTGGSFDNVSAKSLPVTPPARRFIFSEPENVLSVSSNRFENLPHVSKDGLRVYFSSDSAEANVNQFGELPEIYMAERTSVDEPFGERVRLGGREGEVMFLGSVSDDERSIYFSSFSPAGGPEPLYVATRESMDAPFDFANAVALAELGSGQFGHVSNDGLRAYFYQNGPRVATRPNIDSAFTGVQSVGADANQFIEYETSDGLTLFSWTRSGGGQGAADLFAASRSSTHEPFGPFQNLGPVINSPADETFPFFHEATSTLYFSSDRTGTIVPQISKGQAPVRDLWQSKRSFAGDTDFDGLLTAADIDMLSEAVRSGEYHYNFDNNQDGIVDQADRTLWVDDEAFANTYFGDANLDGEFNSSDMTLVFSAAEYEDNITLNSTWAEGDWNGDGDFDSSDLILAFQDGGYEQGPKAVVAVPEPSSFVVILVGVLLGAIRRHCS